MMWKKSLWFILVLLLCLPLIVGCGGSSGGSSPTGQGGATSGGTSSAGGSSSAFVKPASPLDFDFSTVDWSQQPEVKMLHATVFSAVHSSSVNVMEAFSEAEELTGGKLKFDMPYDAILVDDAGMMESLESGMSQLVKNTPSVNVGLIPELEALVYPGYFSGTREEYMAFNRDMDGPVTAVMEKNNFKHVIMGFSGRSGFLTKKSQVLHPDDLKGLILRASGASVGKVIEAYGASATVLGLGDVPTALDRGTVDGLFTSASMVVQLHFTEVANNLTVLTFREMVSTYCMYLPWWNSLTPEMQAAIDYFCEKWFQINYETVDIQDNVEFNKARDDGVSVVELTPEQNKPFETAVKTMFDDLGGRSSAEGLAMLRVIYDHNSWDWAF